MGTEWSSCGWCVRVGFVVFCSIGEEAGWNRVQLCVVGCSVGGLVCCASGEGLGVGALCFSGGMCHRGMCGHGCQGHQEGQW